MDIYDLNVKIRKYCIKSCPLTVIENLTLFFNDTWNLNFKQNNIDFINFYNKIFNHHLVLKIKRILHLG